MIGNNACGNRALGYGRTSDNVVGLEMLTAAGTRLSATTGAAGGPPSLTGDDALVARLTQLADDHLGTIRMQFGRFGRQVSGYALEHLAPERGRDIGRMLVGSEGTLALVTQARVRLVTDPPATCLTVLGFEDIYAAGDVTGDVVATAAQILERLADFTVGAHRRAGPLDVARGDARSAQRLHRGQLEARIRNRRCPFRLVGQLGATEQHERRRRVAGEFPHAQRGDAARTGL